MAEATKIEWCDYSFNPWWGCVRVSPGCKNCYAEAWDRRWGGPLHWGPKSPRKIAGDAYWKQPLKWNRDAQAAGMRKRVFCASMADVFEDRRDLDAPRDRLWKLIAETPWLDWQLLTKRPENIVRLSLWTVYPENVWLGTTVEDQQRADERIPELLRVPALVRFLSCEPLLSEVKLGKWLLDPLGSGIDWVIVGGESGHGARPMRIEWARDLVNRCTDAGVSVFVKQFGDVPAVGEDVWRNGANEGNTLLLSSSKARSAPPGTVVLQLGSKGKDTAKWPGGAEAWPRQFPEARHA